MKNKGLIIDVCKEINRLLDETGAITKDSPIHVKLKTVLSTPEKTQKGKLTAEQETELSTRVIEYNDIFPKAKIPTSGKAARSSPRELMDSFRWFLLNNPQYSWDVILKATTKYVEQKRPDDWRYMRTSQYFIRKQNSDKTWISDLANYCQQIVDDNDDDGYVQQPQHFEKVV